MRDFSFFIFGVWTALAISFVVSWVKKWRDDRRRRGTTEYGLWVGQRTETSWDEGLYVSTENKIKNVEFVRLLPPKPDDVILNKEWWYKENE
jgi:hypothetical protein